MATPANARNVMLQTDTPRTLDVQLPSTYTTTGDHQGTWNTLGQTVHRNDQITLSSDGTLNNAGGGSITDLDYSNVSGTKPAANATANFFTTSGSNPSGGSDGDAHWNSSTSTMWFKTGGVWRVGGTVNANQITVGTLAAARIASNSITSDKINVSTLSAIAANLGTVTAGDITGTSDIDIAGTAKFDGVTSSSAGSAAVVANDSQNATTGVMGFAGASNAYGISGQGSGTGGGVFGIGSSGGAGGRFVASGGGDALNVTGTITISTQTISNLTAGYANGVDGSDVSGTVASATNASNATNATNASNSNSLGNVADSGWCRQMVTESGTASANTYGFVFTSDVSGVDTDFVSGRNFRVYTVSDRRKKEDIQPEVLGLDFINKLRPVSYRHKKNLKIKRHGLIAQEVEPLINDPNDDLARTYENGLKGVDYMSMVGVLIKAIQEQTVIVNKLSQEVEALKRSI